MRGLKLCHVSIFSDISERNYDYTDTLNFRSGGLEVVKFFRRRAFGAPRGSAPMVRYYDSQLRSSLRSLLARRTFSTPKNTGVDALIHIFLVASLEYHSI